MYWILKRKGSSSWFTAAEPNEDKDKLSSLAAKLQSEGYDVRIVRILAEIKGKK